MMMASKSLSYYEMHDRTLAEAITLKPKDSVLALRPVQWVEVFKCSGKYTREESIQQIRHHIINGDIMPLVTDGKCFFYITNKGEKAIHKRLAEHASQN